MKQDSSYPIFAASCCRSHLYQTVFVSRILVPECPARLAGASETLFVTGFFLMLTIEQRLEDAARLQPLLGYPNHTAVQFPGGQW